MRTELVQLQEKMAVMEAGNQEMRELYSGMEE